METRPFQIGTSIGPSLVKAGMGAIRSDARGFSRLGSLYRELSEYQDATIGIDLSLLDWFDGHMASPLRTIVHAAEANGNNIKFVRPKPDVETVLRKNGFLAGSIEDHHKTTIPVTDFRLDEEVVFATYVKKHFDRKEMPRMSAALQGKFFEGIDEMFANSAMHSNSKSGLSACGQFYPKYGRLDFTLSDGGRGIPTAVRFSRKYKPSNDHDAIRWALEDFNTTREGDVPGGLGSKILREFITINGGRLSVASNGGFWTTHRGSVSVFRLSNAIPGTTVLLEINTNDRAKYDLVDPPKPTDIW